MIRNQMESLQKQKTLTNIVNKFKNLTQQHAYIKEAVEFLQQVLVSYPQTTFVSFNGGKDATIVLILTYLAFTNLQNNKVLVQRQKTQISYFPRGIYFEEPSPFPQMVLFYEEMKKIFELEMNILHSKKYAEELNKFSQSFKLDCIIMGSRRDDPYCQHLKLISQSDTHKGYPAFKRVNPIIDWKYEQVWETINTLEIPYCSLYNQGYSSIGNMQNTTKNPTLISQDNTYLDPVKANPQTERICRNNAPN